MEWKMIGMIIKNIYKQILIFLNLLILKWEIYKHNNNYFYQVKNNN